MKGDPVVRQRRGQPETRLDQGRWRRTRAPTNTSTFRESFGTGNPQDWSGKTIHVRIRSSEGTFKGGAQVYAITTGSFIFGGKFTNFAPNNDWQEFTMDVSAPTTDDGASPSSGYDPAKVVVVRRAAQHRQRGRRAQRR